MIVVEKNLGPKGSVMLAGTLELDYEQRCKARLKLDCVIDGQKQVLGLFLPRGDVLKEGDVLESVCGKYLLVKAKKETLIEASTDDWVIFSKACYHLGNRHVQLYVGEKVLCFAPDSVLESLAGRLGLAIREVEAPFLPEPGAYSHGHSEHRPH